MAMALRTSAHRTGWPVSGPGRARNLIRQGRALADKATWVASIGSLRADLVQVSIIPLLWPASLKAKEAS